MSDRATMREAADYLHVPVRCLHGRYIREGLLPWPDTSLTWAWADVEALKRWLDARKRKDASVPRPSHRTH